MPYYNEELDRYILDVPQQCPVCGGELELDTNCEPDGSPNNYRAELYCNDCDYRKDFTKEFQDTDRLNDEDEDNY